jgi:hypothetical protein
MTRAYLFATVLVVSCARRPPPTPIDPTAESALETQPAGDSLGSYAGRYALEPSSAANECGDKLYLAAKNISISPPTMHADVVDRTYNARLEQGVFVADGTFDFAGVCPGTRVFEKWTLQHGPAGTLVGNLESHWSLPPDCQRACVARFGITASPQ